MAASPGVVHRTDGRAVTPPADATQPAPVDEKRPTSWQLFTAFAAIGLCGFGGVLPWARRILVERRGWMTDAQFTDLFSVCQFLPGPNIAGMSLIIGDRYRGVPGALAGFLGLMGPTFAVYMAAGLFYEAYGHGIPMLDSAIGGMASVVGGITVSTGLKMGARLRRSARAVVLIGATFIAIGVLRLPLGWVLLALAPISVAAAYMAERKAA